MLEALLGVYSSYLESVFMVDGRDDLTEQEKKEINAQCNQLRAKCL